MIMFGQVSSALEKELRAEIRKDGVVIWLDADHHYTGFVDGLRARRQNGELPYEVTAYRGSHLELMFQLEGIAAGPTRAPLLIHMPGFNEESIKASPVYEFYLAGKRFRRAMKTLVVEAATSHAAPEAIALFADSPDLSLEAADEWVKACIEAASGGFQAQLKLRGAEGVLQDLLGGTFQLTDPKYATEFWEQWTVWTGITQQWPLYGLGATHDWASWAFALAGWALSVEFVDDLQREPVSPLLRGVGELPQAVKLTCRGIARMLRDHHPDFYQRAADDTQALLADEVQVAHARDLGKIDTFRFEEDLVLNAALESLQKTDWNPVLTWATPRVKEPHTSFWLRRDPSRVLAWELLLLGASLGQAIGNAGQTLGGQSIDEAVQFYAMHGEAVDRLHRHLEQRRAAILSPRLPQFHELRAALDEMRVRWRKWADAWALRFSELSRADGFLPSPPMQQRNIFDDVVKPSTEEGLTAFFVVDGLRYEMGQELMRTFEASAGVVASLSPALAELPSETCVGMNALAPVSNGGKLSAVLDKSEKIVGFSTGEFQVLRPEARKRAMHERVGGVNCPWISLEEVVSRDASSLRQSISRAKLVVVHSEEIDKAGESNVGPSVFDDVMSKLRAAWQLLRDAGVRRFVITSDHGFLLLDDRTRISLPHGRKVDPSRRHVYSMVAADHPGEVRVTLEDLGYVGAKGYLMFPETTAVFEVGKRSLNFVHGGNSLQERVIPVLKVVHRSPSGGNTLSYAVKGKVKEGVAGMHCLELIVEVQAQVALGFGASREIELSMHVPDRRDARVELCQARGARTEAGSIHAPVGKPFEVFFKLSGQTDQRVPVEVFHPSKVADVTPFLPDHRFDLSASGEVFEDEQRDEKEHEDIDWLAKMPDDARPIFEHLAKHGVVTEEEIIALTGKSRAARAFATHVEAYVRLAPFDLKVDHIGGIKRYFREGGKK
ncbi:BREX-6 system phosphatase PglZ [Microvenator marinus]|nr:BREX-6 system phosphatase PglZ [Microvenator marinus]